jgi:ribosomal protein S18 acetylase RimI-like enzyme
MPRSDEPRRKTPLRRLLSALAGRLGVHYYSLYYGEKDLTEPTPEVEPGVDIRIAETAAEDIDELERMRGGDARDLLRESIKIGSRCFVARCGDEPAGYSWVNDDVIDLLGMTLARLPEHVAFTYNSYVFPKFRGKKVFQCLTRAVYDDARRKGRRFVGNLVDRANAPSVAARRRLGAGFQDVRILKLPWLPPLILGRRFVIGGDPTQARP